MHIDKLHLINFKNYQETDLIFSPHVNVLVGKNGSGKTNLLDAIFYLSMTRSAFSSSDQHCIRHGEQFFMVKGQFAGADESHEIVASVQSGAKKIFREDQQDYPRLVDHIGKYPVVLIAPDDVELVRQGSESRRKFFDSIISQLERPYLHNLIQYNHALKQRNSLLKMFSEKGSVDAIVIDSYDSLLARLGKEIYERRLLFATEFLPVFKKYYAFIVEDNESVELRYVSETAEVDYVSALKSSRQRDLLLQRTNFGIHRDDYEFMLGSGDLKRLGSQGQQKSFVIALKLTQFEIMERKKGFKPVLLLDDVFDKLDDYRIARLMELIRRDLGQLFITDARPERTAVLLENYHVAARSFHVEAGTVKLLS